MEGRREFIRTMSGFIASGFVVLSPFFSFVRSGYAKVRRIILPRDTKRESLTRKNPASLDTRNLPVTPLEDFGTMGEVNHETDLSSWRLGVKGHVEAPLDLTYSQILDLPSVERKVLLICPGFFANHGRWKGLDMGPLLEKAKVKPGAAHVIFSGPEGSGEKAERFSIEEIRANRVFLAYGINGKTLPRKHGFPLRVVAEDHYGGVWVKYVYNMQVEGT
jgi:DMSO/TMAO reductase YedYZ molybdopterin-dependent catalytic subunit